MTRHPARLVCVAANPSVDRLVEVERLEFGAIHRPTLVRAEAGGKGLNVARSAAALGARVTAVALLAGHAGRWIRAELAAAGIEGRFAWSAGETRVSTSIADRATTTLTEFYEPGPPIGPLAWRRLERLVDAELRADPDFLTVSGSLPPGAPLDGYARLCGLAVQRGVRLLLDCAGEALEAAFAGRPWLVKLNAREASALGRQVRDDLDAIAAVRAAIERGAGSAVVTLGVDGAVALLEGRLWRVGPPPVRGPYAVGSGDAFLAGLAVGLAQGSGPAEALVLATATAAANAQLPGGGAIDPAMVAELQQRVVVERLGPA